MRPRENRFSNIKSKFSINPKFFSSIISRSGVFTSSDHKKIDFIPNYMKAEFKENDSFASSEIEEQKLYFVDQQVSIDREESMAYFKEDFLRGSKRRTESFNQLPQAIDTIRQAQRQVI